MWWMCDNHNPSGNADGGQDNLQTWNHQQHAVYLATIAKYAHDNWGFDFHSVEAFNEPMLQLVDGDRYAGGLPLRQRRPRRPSSRTCARN